MTTEDNLFRSLGSLLRNIFFLNFFQFYIDTGSAAFQKDPSKEIIFALQFCTQLFNHIKQSIIDLSKLLPETDLLSFNSSFNVLYI